MSDTPWIKRISLLEITKHRTGAGGVEPLDMGYLFTFKNGDTGIIKYEPIGLVGFITPWNYPLLTLSERLPFCIASGCPAIIKPSEFTPTFSKILQKIISSRSNLIKSINILKDLMNFV